MELALVLGSLVLLLGVTLVGHGLWVLVASLFRPRKPASQPRSPAPAGDELLTTELQLTKLLDAGMIDDATHQRVIAAIDGLRWRRLPPPIPVLPMSGPAASELLTPITESDDILDAIPDAIEPPEVRVPELTDLDEIDVPAPQPTPATRPPRPRRKPLPEMFAAFLRESNIRWGELVGGLLIIGCSIALVISFWGQIASKPLLQFGLFTSVTTAMLGLGLYAGHRWKLPTTSRGILLIAMLLVPLNFLAFAALSHGKPAPGLATVGELATLALFGSLVWRAARVLAPYWPRLLASGVLALSGSLLLTRHLGPAQSLTGLLSRGFLPIAIYGAAIGVMLFRAHRWNRIRAHAADAMFLLLGVLTFSAVTAIGLVIFQGEHPWNFAHRLAPLLSLATAPALATGLLLWRRIVDRRLARARTAGTAIAVVSALLMLGTITLAWPDPSSMLPMAAIDFFALTFIALVFEVPAAHVLGGACLLLAYLLGFHVAWHHMGWTSTPPALTRTLLDPTGGAALIPLVMLAAAASVLFSKLRKPLHALSYKWISIAIAVISLGLVTWGGFAVHGEPYHATVVYLLYAAATAFIAWRMRRPVAGWAGHLLLLAAFIQLMVTRTAVAHPWSAALLAYATIAVVVAISSRRGAGKLRPLTGPARWMAVGTSAVALVLLLGGLSIAGAGAVAAQILWVAGIWIALSLVEESEDIFIAGQIALALATALGTIGRLAGRSWFTTSPEPLLDPWTLQAVGIALGSLVIGFSLLRWVLPRRFPASRWLRSNWAFDRVLFVALSAGLAGLALAAILPALHMEFAGQIAHRAINAWSAHAAGIGSWGLLAALLLALALWIRDSASRTGVLLAVAVAALACPLWAARWAEVGAGGSALRWALALFFIALSIPLWLRQHLPLLRRAGLARDLRLLLTALAAMPILCLSVYPAGLTLEGFHVSGPASTCFFGAIGNSISYIIPLLIVAMVFVGNAIGERSAGWAFGASAVCNLTASLGYALAIATAGEPFDLVHGVRLIQVNIIAAGGFALAWQATRALQQWLSRLSKVGRSVGIDDHAPVSSLPFTPAVPPSQTPSLLKLDIALALFGNALLLTPAVLWLFALPARSIPALAAIGDPLGWIALIASIGGMLWTIGGNTDRISAPAISAVLAAMSIAVAMTAQHWNQFNWLSMHVLMMSGVCSTGAILGIAVLIGRSRRGVAQTSMVAWNSPAPAEAPPLPLQYERRDDATNPAFEPAIYVGGELLQPASLRWTGVASALVVLLALRAMIGDPQGPWWSVMSAAMISLIWTAVACWTASPRLLYVGGMMLNLAATMWCLEKPWVSSAHPLMDLLFSNVGVLSISGLAGLVLHLYVFRPAAKNKPAFSPFHRFATAASTCLIAIAASAMLWATVAGHPLLGAPSITWTAFAAAAALAAATLWDEAPNFALVDMYILGLAAMAIALGAFNRSGQWLALPGSLMLDGYVVLTGAVFAGRKNLHRAALRFGMPSLPERTEIAAWLAPANLVLAIFAACMAIAVDFNFTQLSWRLIAATASLAQVAGLWLVTRGDRRLSLRQAALATAALAAVAVSWAWMSPLDLDPLNRSVAVMAALAVVAGCFAFAARLVPQESPSGRALRTTLPPLLGVCAINLLEIIGIEVLDRVSTGSVRMHPWAVAAMIAALVGSAIGAVLLALSPRRDPLQLSEARRGGYIYAAEGLLALAFLHLRLTMPWLFGGMLSRYWPLVVMVLAFGGVALGELFRRRRILALSSPLLRTGIFLPLLPVLAFWTTPSQVSFANLLFTVGEFYAILSAARRSFAFGLLAVLAANGGLWSLLSREPGLGFLAHPQLWLIPAAVSVLVAAQLNRDRLPAPRLRFVRYACLMAIYVSSTADIFLNGVRDHPWLPLVLAGLSVAGVMAGIFLRLRAFLFLGTMFLTLAIVTMIYYASANLHWTWLWYVAGIALGTTIIVLFALFEKKRTEMLAMVEGLKQWQ